MGLPTYQQLITLGSNVNGLVPEALQERLLTIAAMLASGTGPDGTALPGPGAGLLAATYYDPASGTTVNNSTTTFAAVDTTNLRVTFTAPANGIVVVKYGSFITGVQGTSQALLGVLEASTVLAIILGPGTPNTNGPFAGSKRLTGLSAGSHSYDLALASGTGAQTASAKYGGGQTAAGFGPAFIEVWNAV